MEEWSIKIKEFITLSVCLKFEIYLHVLDFHLRKLNEHPFLETLPKDCNINNQYNWYNQLLLVFPQTVAGMRDCTHC